MRVNEAGNRVAEGFDAHAAGAGFLCDAGARQRRLLRLPMGLLRNGDQVTLKSPHWRVVLAPKRQARHRRFGANTPKTAPPVGGPRRAVQGRTSRTPNALRGAGLQDIVNGSKAGTRVLVGTDGAARSLPCKDAPNGHRRLWPARTPRQDPAPLAPPRGGAPQARAGLAPVPARHQGGAGGGRAGGGEGGRGGQGAVKRTTTVDGCLSPAAVAFDPTMRVRFP